MCIRIFYCGTIHHYKLCDNDIKRMSAVGPWVNPLSFWKDMSSGGKKKAYFHGQTDKTTKKSHSFIVIVCSPLEFLNQKNKAKGVLTPEMR